MAADCHSALQSMWKDLKVKKPDVNAFNDPGYKQLARHCDGMAQRSKDTETLLAKRAKVEANIAKIEAELAKYQAAKTKYEAARAKSGIGKPE